MVVYRVIHNESEIEFAELEAAQNYVSEHNLDDPIEVEKPDPDPEIEPVTPRQMRQALLAWNLLSTVEGAINSMSEPTKSYAKVEWEYSLQFNRSHPLVNQMGAALGMTSEQLDNLWLLAATL